MNMFKPVDAKTPKEYIKMLTPETKKAVIEIDKLIRKTAPMMDRQMYGGIIGYGKTRYKTKSGQEGDWFAIGLASQRNYISVYICELKGDKYVAELHKKTFPKASIGRSCIRFKKYEDIDIKKLEKVLKEAVEIFKKRIQK